MPSAFPSFSPQEQTQSFALSRIALHSNVPNAPNSCPASERRKGQNNTHHLQVRNRQHPLQPRTATPPAPSTQPTSVPPPAPHATSTPTAPTALHETEAFIRKQLRLHPEGILLAKLASLKYCGKPVSTQIKGSWKSFVSGIHDVRIVGDVSSKRVVLSSKKTKPSPSPSPKMPSAPAPAVRGSLRVLRPQIRTVTPPALGTQPTSISPPAPRATSTPAAPFSASLPPAPAVIIAPPAIPKPRTPTVVTDASHCAEFLRIARSCNRVAVDCEWTQERLCFVQLWLQPSPISPDRGAWVFDIASLQDSGRSVALEALKEVFSETKITKVLHDCREDASMIYRDLGLKIVGVADTQLMEMALHGEESSRMSLNALLTSRSLRPNPAKDAISKLFKKIPNFWELRPITKDMLEYLVGDVEQLLELEAVLARELAASPLPGRLQISVQNASRAVQDNSAESFSGNAACPRHLLETDLYISFDEQNVPTFSRNMPEGAEKFVPFVLKELCDIGRKALTSLLTVLPAALRNSPVLVALPAFQIEEIVLDLGRKPEMRLSEGRTETLLEKSVDEKLIEEGLFLLRKSAGLPDPETPDISAGIFTSDNRFCVPGTLHRVSCVRYHTGRIIGLVYRVGKHLPGAVSILRDFLFECSARPAVPTKSLLVLGRPGLGKTTLLREASKHLADTLEQRVVIVDTSSEIAGGGAIPHPCVGRCRRLFVPERSRQYMVMTEAVQNHNPQVIVIDEMGTSQEVEASRTISQRGVALLGTAHGSDLSSLLKNPVCRPLVGGVQVVILSDRSALDTDRKLRTQRAGAPCFDMVIEVIDHNDFLCHPSTSGIVDAMLQNSQSIVQRRWFDKETGVMRARFSARKHSEKFNA